MQSIRKLQGTADRTHQSNLAQIRPPGAKKWQKFSEKSL